jgi:hypothetical protein
LMTKKTKLLFQRRSFRRFPVYAGIPTDGRKPKSSFLVVISCSGPEICPGPGGKQGRRKADAEPVLPEPERQRNGRVDVHRKPDAGSIRALFNIFCLFFG